MHLSDEIKNNNNVISFYYRARDFFTSVNVIFINSVTFVKDDSLILTFFFSFINNIS